MKDNAIAIIPARGGSKRFPRKNLCVLEGVPLFVRVAKTALASKSFQRVLVSTEDQEIEEVALREGIEVFRRSSLTASDESTVVDVCVECLKSLKSLPDIFCCIYATAALVEENDLKEAALRFDADSRPNTVMGVGEYNLHPFKALEKGPEGWFKELFPDRSRIKGQFLPRLVASNGSFYWADTKWFLENRSFAGGKMLVHMIPEDRWQDVDYPEDFKRLQAKFEKYCKDIT